MPINLNNLSQNTNLKPTNTPKFFHKDLTGSGNTVGLFNENTNSINNNVTRHLITTKDNFTLFQLLTAKKHDLFVNYPEPQVYADDMPTNIYDDPSVHKNLTLKWSTIKTYKHFDFQPWIPIDDFSQYDKVPYDLTQQLLAKYKQIKIAPSTTMLLLPLSLDLYHIAAENSSMPYTLGNLTMSVVVINRPDPAQPMQIFKNSSVSTLSKSINDNFISIMTPSYDHLIADIDDLVALYNYDPVKSKDLSNQIKDLPFDQALITTADKWTDDKFDYVSAMIKLQEYNSYQPLTENLQETISRANWLIEKIDDKLTENDYQQLFKTLVTIKSKHQIDDDTFNQLLTVNTRLSLTNQLLALSKNQQVHQFNPTHSFNPKNGPYSNEQTALITTTAPYSIGVAGAGSGKSHTLIGRLDYLSDNNVDLAKVLVLSFTNTAAKNITNRYGNKINSLTFANLINKIYQNNFSHQLTNDGTLVNTLLLIKDNSPLMSKTPTIKKTKHQFEQVLNSSIPTKFRKVDLKAVIQTLNTIINEHFDDVMMILDSINQTSLTIQPLIINAMLLKHKKINEPDFFKSLDYIITDESQDISSFEYVLLLNITNTKNSQLMIIGDANQTLYEFREANPNFLNALERSSVFTTYTMSTNYRSHQEILMFANKILKVLTTNETSKLQLHANKYTEVTPDTFHRDVTLKNVVKLNSQEFNIADEIRQRKDIQDWIIDKYNHHEQIAIMAFRNADADNLQAAVHDIIKERTTNEPTLARITPKRKRPSTTLSSLFSKHHDNKFSQQLKRGYITINDIADTFKLRMEYQTVNYRYEDKWADETIKTMLNSNGLKAMIRQFNQNQISSSKFVGWLALQLTNAETRHNQVSALLKDEQPKINWKKADVVTTTIHSSKGLEFDNVICLFNETSRVSTTQSSLRLFGVALTRAKNHELIINVARRKAGSDQPTDYGSDVSDMFITPMRTAYQQCLLSFKTQN